MAGEPEIKTFRLEDVVVGGLSSKFKVLYGIARTATSEPGALTRAGTDSHGASWVASSTASLCSMQRHASRNHLSQLVVCTTWHMVIASQHQSMLVLRWSNTTAKPRMCVRPACSRC